MIWFIIGLLTGLVIEHYQAERELSKEKARIAQLEEEVWHLTRELKKHL